jgi:hypothetical protein
MLRNSKLLWERLIKSSEQNLWQKIFEGLKSCLNFLVTKNKIHDIYKGQKLN